LFGRLPVSGRQRRDVALYNTKRFVTLTGDRLPDCPDTIADRQAVIDAWYPQLFPSAPRPALEPAAGPVLDDDLALIQRAQRARNGATFRKLWAGDDSDYPSRSEADMALAAILGFWAQRNETRVDALFRMSGLMRPKWDEPRGDTTYGALTVRHAVRTVLAVYDPEYSRKEGDVTAAVREALRKTLR
jgi:primase-polymerase (primpol)-like protein